MAHGHFGTRNIDQPPYGEPAVESLFPGYKQGSLYFLKTSPPPPRDTHLSWAKTSMFKTTKREIWRPLIIDNNNNKNHPEIEERQPRERPPVCGQPEFDVCQQHPNDTPKNHLVKRPGKTVSFLEPWSIVVLRVSKFLSRGVFRCVCKPAHSADNIE